jgi:hypothetical protein
VSISNCNQRRHYHDNIVERSETVVISSKLLIVMSRLFDRASQGGFNGGIIEKSLHISPRWSFFSPANGQFFIATRRRKACRRLLPPPACYPRQCASGPLIVILGVSSSTFCGDVFGREARAID